MDLCILCGTIPSNAKIPESPLLDSLEDVRHRGEEAKCHRGQDTV